MNAYRRNGVREYVVWRTWEGEIDWFMLHSGRYEAAAGHGGICQSEVFPGLWLDPAALVRGDLARVLDVLPQGLATAEHAEFVKRLQNSRR